MITFEKEKIKTTFIVVLLCISILLLYFLWQASVLEKKSLNIITKTSEEQEEEMDYAFFLKPFRLRINFGASKYTVLYTGFDEIWNAYISAFKTATQTEVYIQEIEESQWTEILNKKSIKFDLGYNIPYASMTHMIEATKTEADDMIQMFSSGVYSSASPESFFIYDQKNNKYYRIVSEDSYSTILDPLDALENNNFDKYYPMNSIFGVGTNLMPYSLKNNIQITMGEQEIKPYEAYEEEKIKALAEKFFGESFDFVRKIVEIDGTVVYMYGYGQKMLLIDSQGFLEYKEDVSNENTDSLSFTASLSKAVSYITEHGHFRTFDGTSIYPYLKEVVSIERSKKGGYQFIFGYRINGYPVYYQNDEALKVEVVENQVTYYRRYLLNQKDTMQYMTNEDEETGSNVIPAAIILTNNYKYIRDVYVESGLDIKEKTDDEIFNEIVGLIDKIDVGYYSSNQSSEEAELKLIPSWIFSTDHYQFFFDAQTGKALGFKELR